MGTPCEYTLVEKPVIDQLTGLYGYHYVPPSQHTAQRGHHQNEVFFTPLLVESLVRINGIPESDAVAIASELQALSDPLLWLKRLRGDYSKKISGQDTHSTIRLVDFDNPSNNHFAVTNQLKISGAKNCIPDLIIYLNGIPVVVIEAKSPLSPSQNTWSAVKQILQYEVNVPRLFASNLFNIATNDLTFLYAATGSPSEHWARWRDPWPRKAEEFFDQTALGIYALLSPERLLDILAHFVVYETTDGKTVKKICRYQQYRAVNKMFDRAVQGDARQGLIWHTQGSGKSLTMVFAALKLKFHRGCKSELLSNPNLLVITDRKDLHNQISATFAACGLPNPLEADSISKLRELVVPGVAGRTVMSTIFKFHWDVAGLKSHDFKERQAAAASLALEGSENWILMVDEAHRTQEKDLGAYLRAVLPKALRFGFTGTPVRKGDKDTFQNFGVAGENYLDKYGIMDAVNDGATVPVYYQGRLTNWHLEGKEIDIVFDQYFSNESDEVVETLKNRGVTKGDLARFRPRIAQIALDLWTHFRTHVQPDGFKAQVVAIDRPACVVYKQELDRVIANSLVKLKGLSQAEAEAQAAATSVCIYSPSQHDQQKHPELVTYQLDPQGEKDAIEAFKKKDHPLKILIVCNKLLTGFDAPVEQVMYLDNPLTDHNLLQAIARTNRRCGSAKEHGSLVDYIGVTKNLVEALAAYNDEDIQGALTDEDALYGDLQTAHREVMAMLKGVPRTGQPKIDAQVAVEALDSEDVWFEFSGKANAFLVAYGALTPDPRVLPFKADLEYIGSIIPYGKAKFEADTTEVDWRQYSEKIREILNLHLQVTGLSTVYKIRSLADPDFWSDFEQAEKNLEMAAVRKMVELKKEIAERVAKSPARYAKFSERVQKLISDFQKGLVDAAEVLKQAKVVAEQAVAEDSAFEKSGLNEQAYDVLKILELFRAAPEASESGEASVAAEGSPAYQGAPTDGASAQPSEPKLTPQQAAEQIDQLYRTDELASAYWQLKEESRKKLLQKVRRIVKSLNIQDWKAMSSQIDHYAISHYAQP
jgi:type I restriction enzyme R subunit